MKKRIIFQFFTVLIVTLHMQAMEKPDPSVPVNDICYLRIIPVDICNYMMNLLMWALVQDLKKQTQETKKVPGEYYKKLPRSISTCLSWNNEDITKNMNAVFCPNGTKIALFELCCGMCGSPGLMIIDTQKEKEEEKIMYHDKLAKENYCALGLSASGKAIAVIKKQETVSNNNCHMQGYYDVLTIQKMVKKEEKLEFEEVKRFSIPKHFTPQKLCFNKQNSHLIMYGKNTSTDPLSNFTDIVFPLHNFKRNEKTISVEEKNKLCEENELFNYFNYNVVCKSIEQKKL